MKSLFKNLNLGAVIALVSVVTLTVSWKNHESKRAAQWFEVTETAANDGSRAIVGEYPNGAPSAPCNEDNGKVCAVEIDLKSYTGPMPSNLQEAQTLHDNGQIELGTRVYKTP